MLAMDNRSEVDLGGFTREVPASQFWEECSKVSCRARGPVAGQHPTSDIRHPTSKGNALAGDPAPVALQEGLA